MNPQIQLRINSLLMSIDKSVSTILKVTPSVKVKFLGTPSRATAEGLASSRGTSAIAA